MTTGFFYISERLFLINAQKQKEICQISLPHKSLQQADRFGVLVLQHVHETGLLQQGGIFSKLHTIFLPSSLFVPCKQQQGLQQKEEITQPLALEITGTTCVVKTALSTHPKE